MKSISKEQRKELDEYRGKLEDARRIVEEALERAQEIVNKALEEVNETREEAAEFVREIWGKAEDYTNERSEKWLESDAGEQYRQWMSEIDGVANELESEIELDLASFVNDELEAIESLSSKLDEIPNNPGE